MLEDATQYGLASAINVVSLPRHFSLCSFPTVVFRELLLVEWQRTMTRASLNYVHHANTTPFQLVLEIRRFFVSLVLQKDSFTEQQRAVLVDTVLAQNRIVDVGHSTIPHFQRWQDCTTDDNNSPSLEVLLSSLQKS